MKDTTDKAAAWMSSNPGLFSKMVAAALLAFGVLLIIGAFKDWDWLYSADGHYQNNWSMGQISRYLGRRTARVIGFAGGIGVTAIGLFLCYGAFIKAR
jgi:hypothetical protein